MSDTSSFANLSLIQLERKLHKSLDGLKFWGDLDISLEDYDVLKNLLKERIEHGMTFQELIEYRPISVVTFAVFLAKYKYNGNFWGVLAEELGLEGFSQLEQTRYGKRFFKVFLLNGFDVSRFRDTSRIYVNAILFEIGEPPESNVGDLFYIFKYSSLGASDPQAFVEELQDTGSYQIHHKPLLQFLQNVDEETAVDYVLEVQDAYQEASQSGSCPGKYERVYEEWEQRDLNRSRRTSKGGSDSEASLSPYFHFENGKRGLCIVLPRKNIENGWVDTAEWTIRTATTEYRKTMQIFGNEGRRYADEFVVPVSPEPKYEVVFSYDDGIDKPVAERYILDNLSKDHFLFFNASGRKIRSEYLQKPFGILVYSTSENLDFSNVNSIIQHYPTDSQDYKTIQIIPTGMQSKVTIGIGDEKKLLRMRPQVEIGLEGETLFGLNPEDVEVPIFTDIPSLRVSFDGFGNVSGMEVRCGENKAELSDISAEMENLIQVDELIDKGRLYGYKTVRIYQNNHFLKQAQFVVVPKFATNYSNILRWPDSNAEPSSIWFEKVDGWNLEFENANVSESKDKYKVTVTSKEKAINLKLSSSSEILHFSIDIVLPLFGISAVITDGQDESKTTIPLAEFAEKKYWAEFSFFNEYRDRDYSLEVITVNGVEQQKQISPLGNININQDLSIFTDTLANCPLPAKIVLKDERLGHLYTVAKIVDVMTLSHRPVYSPRRNAILFNTEDDIRECEVREWGTKHTYTLVVNQDVALDEKGRRIVSLDTEEKLPPGLYYLDDFDEASLFDETDEGAPEVSLDTLFFYVKEKSESGMIDTVSLFINELIRDTYRYRKSIDRFLESPASRTYGVRTHLKREDFEDYDYLSLIALVGLLHSKLSNQHKELLGLCLNWISDEVLTGIDRLRLLRALVLAGVNVDFFDEVVNAFKLFLFEAGEDLEDDAIVKLNGYSAKLALLYKLKSNAPIRNVLGVSQYRDILGSDAIQGMIHSKFMGVDTTLARSDIQHFMREEPCGVTITLNPAMSGNQGDIDKSDMMIIDMTRVSRTRITFDKNKIPEGGIYFDGIKYIDQYVNWYIRNYPRGEEMDEDKREQMVDRFDKFKDVFLRDFGKAKEDSYWGDILTEYNKVLKLRTTGATNYFSIPTYFYYQAMAAILSLLPDNPDTNNLKNAGMNFIRGAIIDAPHLAERDYLMAAFYVYMKGKEKKLCR